METDNQNNWDPIRLQLEQADRFPGEAAFDKAAAWDKLHSRLNKRSSRRKPIFYWAAAAMLLFTVGLGWFKNRSTADPRQEAITRHSLPAPTPPASAHWPERIIPAANENKPAGRVARNGEIMRKRQDKGSRKKQLSINPGIITPVVVAAPSINLPAVISENVSPAVVIQAAPVRKLKTIHNNRLNSILYKPELSVGDAGHFSPSPTGYLYFGHNRSDNILQIKLSSNN